MVGGKQTQEGVGVNHSPNSSPVFLGQNPQQTDAEVSDQTGLRETTNAQSHRASALTPPGQKTQAQVSQENLSELLTPHSQ